MDGREGATATNRVDVHRVQCFLHCDRLKSLSAQIKGSSLVKRSSNVCPLKFNAHLSAGNEEPLFFHQKICLISCSSNKISLIQLSPLIRTCSLLLHVWSRTDPFPSRFTVSDLISIDIAILKPSVLHALIGPGGIMRHLISVLLFTWLQLFRVEFHIYKL